MKTSAFFCLLLSAVPFSLAAGPGPIEHIDADGRYKVVYPGKPKMTTGKGQGNLKVYVSAVEGADWALTVNYYDLPANLPTTEEFVKKGLLSEARTQFVVNKGMLKSHKYAKFQKEFWSIEYEGTFTKPYEAQIRARSVLVNGRIYNIVVVGSAEFLKSEPAQKFFDSFQVTK